MKQHLKTIEEMLDLFGENVFYTISLSDYNTTLQGKFNSSIIKRCQQDEWAYNVEDNGFVYLRKNNVIIILTD